MKIYEDHYKGILPLLSIMMLNLSSLKQLRDVTFVYVDTQTFYYAGVSLTFPDTIFPSV